MFCLVFLVVLMVFCFVVWVEVYKKYGNKNKIKQVYFLQAKPHQINSCSDVHRAGQLSCNTTMYHMRSLHSIQWLCNWP